MKLTMKSGNCVIDGRSFAGNNICISNGVVTIDGVVQDGELSGDINVTVNGNVDVLENQVGTITAHNVGEATAGSGDINCNNVSGSVSTGSGDIRCGSVGGNVRTGSGDITHN